MRSGKAFCFICFILLFLISACQNEKADDNDYSGVSDLISGRNKARYDTAERAPVKNTRSKPVEENIDTSRQAPDSKTEEILPIVLYEEKVDIIGSESKETLAKGVAYINKNGQIVRIKILKE
ncbi:MAG: hypothetical protein A2277_21260 [Desulfobacterales bacterium RIFOXYA12_FULL_46_15]|nr:MAG: hypothetical protein A2277_21260 [Desulfobacterales bacterium RIFOXYA12_FULL_46_15]